MERVSARHHSRPPDLGTGKRRRRQLGQPFAFLFSWVTSQRALSDHAPAPTVSPASSHERFSSRRLRASASYCRARGRNSVRTELWRRRRGNRSRHLTAVSPNFQKPLDRFPLTKRLSDWCMQNSHPAADDDSAGDARINREAQKSMCVTIVRHKAAVTA